MIYFIFIFGIVITGTLLFLIPVIKFCLKQMLFVSPYKNHIHVVEKFYRGVDLYSSIKYIDEKVFHKPPAYFSDHNSLLILNQAKKEYIIATEVHKLAKKMLKEGFIEISESEDFHSPYLSKEILLKVKVYKPE